jgi:hypothetical protein
LKNDGNKEQQRIRGIELHAPGELREPGGRIDCVPRVLREDVMALESIWQIVIKVDNRCS